MEILLITIQISLIVLIVLAVLIYRATVNQFGGLKAKASGKDLQFVLDRTKGGATTI